MEKERGETSTLRLFSLNNYDGKDTEENIFLFSFFGTWNCSVRLCLSANAKTIVFRNI